MKNLSKIIMILCCLVSISAAAQMNDKGCDKIYKATDQPAVYKNGMSDVTAFLVNDLMPAFNSCIYDKENLPTKLMIVLTIDKNGTVVDATFPKKELSGSCQFALKEKLLKMNGWKAAIKDGQRVCSNFTLPIGCLKWAE